DGLNGEYTPANDTVHINLANAGTDLPWVFIHEHTHQIDDYLGITFSKHCVLDELIAASVSGSYALASIIGNFPGLTGTGAFKEPSSYHSLKRILYDVPFGGYCGGHDRTGHLPIPPGRPGGSGPSRTVGASDPNAKFGPAGFGPQGFVTPDQVFP